MAQGARRQFLKDRIQFVVQRATGFRTTDPKLWEKEWNESYDWYKPTSSETPARLISYSYYTAAVVQTVTRMSCFPAGTPVMTLDGPVAIEQIRIGDRVLAQHPKTGELGYQTVQFTTLRPATTLVKIGTGPNTLRATRGHPFWVTGDGWRLAKDLKAGDRLHALSGAVVIDRLEDAPPMEAYNLVVSDWHTYFVGHERILVHDNAPLEETDVVLPGLNIESNSAAIQDPPTAKNN